MKKARVWIFSQKSYELGASLVWGICNFAINLEPNSLPNPNFLNKNSPSALLLTLKAEFYYHDFFF